MSKAPPAPGRVTGYTVVLPPGWCRIPVRHGSEKAIRAVVREALKSVPRSVPRDRIAPYRVELESRLRTMVTGARGQGGVDLYLPAGPVHGIPVSASFLVSEGVLGPSGEDVDPVRVVTYLATEDGAGAPVTVDGAAAVRAEHTAPAEPGAEVETGSRRVDYMIPVPGGGNRWMIVTFAAMGGGDPEDKLSGVLVQLFDAIMSTFRWSRE
jgi:hypothetical protein